MSVKVLKMCNMQYNGTACLKSNCLLHLHYLLFCFLTNMYMIINIVWHSTVHATPYRLYFILYGIDYMAILYRREYVVILYRKDYPSKHKTF